jgi:hypothetical protein
MIREQYRFEESISWKGSDCKKNHSHLPFFVSGISSRYSVDSQETIERKLLCLHSLVPHKQYKKERVHEVSRSPRGLKYYQVGEHRAEAPC